MAENAQDITYHPLTVERWDDVEKLFGKRGACGGCWCMYWKTSHSEFSGQKGEGNKNALRASVSEGAIPGLLAYVDGEPAGWCAVEPRNNYSRLARSRILKPVDDKPVWSVVCFFVAKKFRNQGMTIRLLQAAVNFVRQQGGMIVEGYPVEPKTDKMPDVFAYTGLASAFRKTGFEEVARRSDTRPVMRYYIRNE